MLFRKAVIGEHIRYQRSSLACVLAQSSKVRLKNRVISAQERSSARLL
ncbi:hypothetical protein FHR87_003394 [Azomonas macrocytogenes]|uniref:Uncharacterized protein n=1 Tax=Azomonas macrocytogenes TaxID=69962 RepID=A0A839TA93_AZOMA|nr:hypothetical protein [Azomonas macrocytogenes]